MSALLEHAKRELALIPTEEGDEMQKAMNDHLIKMVKVFSEEGHSGFSANYAINILTSLLRFEPLTPLRGTDDEWVEVAEDLWQNNRCGHVFKDKTGAAYDSEAVIFKEPNGNCYMNSQSRRFITFPYIPKTEYVDAPRSSLILPGGNA